MASVTTRRNGSRFVSFVDAAGRAPAHSPRAGFRVDAGAPPVVPHETIWARGASRRREAGGADVTDEASMPKLSDLRIKLFTDGADKAQIVEMAKHSWIRSEERRVGKEC